MARLQAPTLLGLIGLGFAVVGLPLVIAIVTAIVQVDGLARDSREALVAVQQNASISRTLADRVLEMERTARQYQALADPAYKALYEEHRAEVHAMLERLAALNEHADMRELLETVREAETRANETVESLARGTSSGSLEAAFTALQDDILTIVQRLDSQARELSNALPERADTLQELLMGQAGLVIPLSVVLALLFGVLISRSVGQVDRGIRSLGGGVLREPIRVKGAKDLEELGLRLEWLRVRLLELEAQKAEFLRNVSHELKTPLTNIREAAELLLEDGQSTGEGVEGRAIAEILKSNSVRLQQMIEELLRYGAVGAFGLGQSCEAVRLDELVSQALAELDATGATKTVCLMSSLSPVVVEGSPARVRVIVDNLLSNAVKFTPRGGEIAVDVYHDEGIAVLDVRDGGPGVRDQDAPHIFDWFFTGVQPANAVVAGSGMGLAIAQEYAQQLGGQILLLPSSNGAHLRLTLKEKPDDEH